MGETLLDAVVLDRVERATIDVDHGAKPAFLNGRSILIDEK